MKATVLEDEACTIGTLTPEQQALVLQWKPMAEGMARKHTPFALPWLYNDLLSEGVIGLIRAALRFDPAHHVQFQSYAVYWIRAYIFAFLLRNHGPVQFAGKKEFRQVFFRYGRARRAVPDGDPEKMAKFIGVSVENFKAAEVRVRRGDVWLDGVPGMASRMPDDKPTVEEVVEEKHTKAALVHHIKKALVRVRKHNPREAYILRKRFLSSKKVTLEDLATEFGISRERVRQVELRAKANLKKALLRDAKFELAINDFI
jgi:RNA polymerase sigma-32 factor